MGKDWREKLKKDQSASFIVMFYWFGLLAFLFYIYLPLKFIGLMLIGGVTCAAFNILFTERRTTHGAHYLNITLSALALYYHWQWGFTFISFHLERYYCWIVLVVSVIAYLVSLSSLLWNWRKKHVPEK